MIKKHLGETIDLHTGGVDLLFPHHENEIAQSECCNGQQFSRHWFHNEHLLVEGKKMSKSLGNLYTLDDLTAKGFSSMALRYALLMGHPRKQLNFSLDSLHAAESAVSTLHSYFSNLVQRHEANRGAAPSGKFDDVLNALKNDLNFPAAFGVLFSAINALRVENTTPGDLAAFIRATWALGILLKAEFREVHIVPDEISVLAEKRWAAKQAKDFAAADALRKELTAAGWSMLDRKDGYSLEPLKKS